MKKVISIVLNNFKNDSRVLKENISLQKAGYDIQVVALHEEPLKEYDEVQNIPVHRIKLKTRGWSKQKLVQLIKYFEFIYRVVNQYKNSDILHCNDLNSLPIGVIVKKFFNREAKIVYDAHEHETETNGLSGLMKKLTKLLEKSLIKFVDRTITVSDSIAEDYKKMYNINKPVIIYNTPGYKEVEKNDYFREKFNIVKNNYIYIFQGALVQGRGVEEILETFKKGSGSKRSIVFLGYGSLVPLIQAYEKELDNIFYHEAVSPTDILNYTVSADFGINGMIDEGYCKSYDYSLPNKLFEYLMAELPVIVTLPEMSRFVSRHKIGVKAKSKNYIDLVKAFEEIERKDLQEMKKNIQEVKREYCWEKQEEVLLNLYKELDAS
ncbi:MAG: glycosyltransferase [Sulfurospirillum sp.]|nr:glycosyltransferase [Sulfurospirillum sp.]